MKSEPSEPLHPEEAKLASVLVCFFGVLIILMGGMMWFGLANYSGVDRSGAATLVWFGLATVIHGAAIRRVRQLMRKPRWTCVAFFLGIVSFAGLYHSIWERDVVAAIGMLPMQLFALFALWHSTWRHASE